MIYSSIKKNAHLKRNPVDPWRFFLSRLPWDWPGGDGFGQSQMGQMASMGGSGYRAWEPQKTGGWMTIMDGMFVEGGAP